ncbi:MAG: acyl-CoA dehydrogenase family protein [Spirochaetes bacterium]|nr:acyl-CoA dehydrogenase family protein [Spirochaetota bacterium]
MAMLSDTERAELLKLRNSRATLTAMGRLLVDGRELSLWEQDTETLPRGARKWRGKARRFAQKFIRPLAPAADLDPHGFDPRPLVREATRQGFQTLILPFPLGTASPVTYLGSTIIQVAVTAEEFATECGGLALLLMAHNLGIAPVLMSGHLRSFFRHMVPVYLKGAWLGRPTTMAFAITEPGAGSDAEYSEGAARAKLSVTARKAKGGYVLTGTKVFISDGAIADKITVYAKLEGEGIESWTCFLVDKNMKGFSVGRRERKMGQRAADASEIVLDDVFVPDRNIIGKVRSGWANNHNVLNYSRPVVGAMALGHGRGAFERALAFCREARSGGVKLIDRQEVQYELADMALSLWAARCMVWRSCANFRASQAASSAAKIVASDTAFRVASRAMELMGDAGCLHVHGVERSWRDSRLTQIYEGTNQINRLDIVEHQWGSDFGGVNGEG